MSCPVAVQPKPTKVGHRILVVDDDAAILDLVVWALEDEGYRTDSARDGFEALEVISRARPDLIVLDLRMPRLSGWELYHMLRADPTTARLPVVVMTADKTAHHAHPTLPGARILAKPFDLRDLVSTINDLLP